MSLAITNRFETHIQPVAKARPLTTDEALDRILQAGDMTFRACSRQCQV